MGFLVLSYLVSICWWAMCLWLGLLLMGGSWVAHGWVQHGPWLQACAEAGAGLGRCAVKASATPCAYGLVVVGS